MLIFVIYRLTGNVGIGTINPDAALEVAKDIAYSGTAIRVTNTNTLNDNGVAFETFQGGRSWLKIFPRGNLEIWDMGDTTMGVYLHPWSPTSAYFKNSVGIGTTEPDEKLEVDGNAHITGDLTVDGTISPFPLRVYDSGWFYAEVGASDYVLTHNLGTTKCLMFVMYSQNSDGANSWMGNPNGVTTVDHISAAWKNLTTTQITLATGNVGGWPNHLYFDGHNNSWNSGYVRLIMLALE